MNTFVDMFESIGDAFTDLIDSMRTGLIHLLGGYTTDDEIGVFNKVEHLSVTCKYSLRDIFDKRFEYSVAKCQEELMTKLIPYVRQYVDFEACTDPATDEYITKAHLRVVNLKEDNYNAQH